MKKIILFLIILLLVPVVIAESPYVCVTEGLFGSVFGNANVTGPLTAEDFLLYNGSSCCGGVGGGSSFDPSLLDTVNTTMLDNDTIIRNYNTSWIDSWYTGISPYTVTNFTVDYNAITSRYDDSNFTATYDSISYYKPLNFTTDYELRTDRYTTTNHSLESHPYVSNSSDAIFGTLNTTISYVDYIKFKNDTTHILESNSTCVIIKGDTSELHIC